jgi:hypothetical protein
MATTAKLDASMPTPEVKAPRVKREPIALVTRMKMQLSTAAVRNKITVQELEALEQHVTKLKGLLA